MDLSDIRLAYDVARERLLAERSPGGFWVGELSSSALSTATAVSALALGANPRHAPLVHSGVRWLASHQNPDGGWGDTPDSPSHLATTMLVQAALRIAKSPAAPAGVSARADAFLSREAGASTHERVRSVVKFYGDDRTFAAPILVNCAIAGLVDWRDVPRLPFELANLPRRWFRRLNLRVVSYALPALVAIGQLVHLRRPTVNPLLGFLRDEAVAPTLRLLSTIQPSSGGFLEAAPLTSFVVMSLVAAGRPGHPVVRRGLAFLENGVQPDGSWPIDTNLSTWVTTQAVDALSIMEPITQDHVLRPWLLDQQHTELHPYTDSPPGGWAWTCLSGGVPDADDTAGALLALRRLDRAESSRAAAAGLRWLLDLQNLDGGWPTFCRGWGRLPFDRSSPDLTAHALRALAAWHGAVDPARERRALSRALRFLRASQLPDGSWLPLWFGNQLARDQANPVYGTSRVLTACAILGRTASVEAQRGLTFLLSAQNPDGGWGGEKNTPSTVEETALATRAFADSSGPSGPAPAALAGSSFLAQRILQNGLAEPAPIGLYFSKLWYSERLYPLIWTVAALGSVLRTLERRAGLRTGA